MRKTIAIIILLLTISYTHAINLDFDSNLFLGANNGMQDNYDNLYFQYDNNVLGGVIFWQGVQTITPTDIIFGSQTITGCTNKIRGAYYNPARGNRLRPLDTATLDQRVLTENVLNLPQTYGQLALSGGLYTNCQGNPNAVYGYVRHIWNGSTHFHLIAGATMDVANNSYTNTPDTNLQIHPTTLNANGFIFDPLGGIASIGTPPVCGNGIIEVGETCDDGNTDSGDGCSSTCQIESGRSCTGEPSICTPISTQQGTGVFNARLQFPSLYTNTPFVNGLIYVTTPAGYIIQGDTQGTFAGTVADTTSTNIILTDSEGVKTLNTTFTSLDDNTVITGTVQITLDTTPPTVTITNPSSGSVITGSIQATRTAQDNIGIQSALIQVYQGNTLVYTNTSTSNNQNIDILADGEYTLSITVYDLAGNSSSQSIAFTVSQSQITNNLSMTGFDSITGAALDTYYTSSPIIIAGLGTGVSISGSIDTGTLIKNGLDIGTGATFTNGDSIRIGLRSANTYNTTRTANLSIHGSTIPFSITTKLSIDDSGTPGGFCLSTNQYALIFLAMQQAYGDNEIRFREALILMRSMITDIITVTAQQGGGPTIYALQCFADIIDDYLTAANTLPPSEDNPNQWIYIAPNGKEYRVEFLPDIQGYTSPDFIYRKIFMSYKTFTRHIDVNNPGTTSRNHIVDTSFTPVVHTAPNGKTYTIQKTNRGFMSYNFIVPAYFESLDRTKAHINRHNPK